MRISGGLSAIRLFLAVMAASPHAEAEGIFADFETTLGNFSCELNFEAAPLAVANFIGLAEGSRPWIDPATGAVKVDKPYYDGITFHRVIEGFMNQSGSRNGQGSDGPGYTFLDEVANGLSHDESGVLSMANSGPNTNGAQFFVTVEPTPWLDGLHTVFGRVVDGMDVVMAINSAPKFPSENPPNPASIPNPPIILERVTIRRVGTAASAFDIQAQNLPVCRAVPGRLEVQRNTSTTFIASQPVADSAVLHGWRSPDLQSWQRLGQIYNEPGGSPFSEVTLDAAELPNAFYYISVTDYPVAFGPASYANRTLEMELPGNQSFVYQFNAAGNGGSIIDDLDGDVLSGIFSVWDQSAAEPYQKIFIMQTSTTGFQRITLVFDESDESFLRGRVLQQNWSGVFWVPSSPNRGTFTLTR